MEIYHIPTRVSPISLTSYRHHRIPRTNIVNTRNHRNFPSFQCSIAAVTKSGPDNNNNNNNAANTNHRMFILGMGYVGQFFARDLKQQGWFVSGTCTSFAKKKKLEEMGFDDVYLFDANELEPKTIDAVKYSTHLLVSVPPVAGIGDPMLQHEELLHKLKHGNLRWLGYLSSTSVYGDCGGQWVDEEYVSSPTNESAISRLAAEKGWLKLGDDLGFSVQAFRLGGIYGPGRSAVDTMLKQKHLSDSQKRRLAKQYTSRVHVADICQALKAAIDTPSSGKVYNIVDDDPAPREEVFAFARCLVEEKWPGSIKPDLLFGDVESSDKKRRSEGEKRVSNARMKKELGVSLLYPSYRCGLKSIIAHLQNPVLNTRSAFQA